MRPVSASGGKGLGVPPSAPGSPRASSAAHPPEATGSSVLEVRGSEPGMWTAAAAVMVVMVVMVVQGSTRDHAPPRLPPPRAAGGPARGDDARSERGACG